MNNKELIVISWSNLQVMDGFSLGYIYLALKIWEYIERDHKKDHSCVGPVKQAAVGQGFTCRGLATTSQYSLMRARSIGVICQDFEGDSSPSWTHRNMGLWVLDRLARSLQICKRKEKKQPRIIQWQYYSSWACGAIWVLGPYHSMRSSPYTYNGS
jgi:hypothetical protein